MNARSNKSRVRVRRGWPWIAAAVMMVIIGAAEGAALWLSYQAWRRADARVATRHRELMQLTRLEPPPTERVAEVMAAELAEARAVIDQLEHRFDSGEARSREDRPDPAQVFFELAAFRERMRAAAKAQSVAIATSAAQMGFARHEHEGPEAEWAGAMSWQLQVIETILESLVCAGPEAIVVVQREDPATAKNAGPRLASRSRDTRAGSDDFFPFNPAMRTGAPDHFESAGFRLVFTGRTTVLRDFVNRLARLERPIFVRSVEVAPAGSEPLRPALAASPRWPMSPATPGFEVLRDNPEPAMAAPELQPLVAGGVSRFDVVVECLALRATEMPEE